MLSWEGPYLFNLNDDPYKKLLICVQQKVIYDDKKVFLKNINFNSNEANHLNFKNRMYSLF